MLEICRLENISIKEDVARELIEVCKGDMRKVVNLLQSMKLSLGQEDNVTVNKDRFFEIVGSIPQDVIQKIFDILCSKDYTQAREGKLTRSEGHSEELRCGRKEPYRGPDRPGQPGQLQDRREPCSNSTSTPCAGLTARNES